MTNSPIKRQNKPLMKPPVTYYGGKQLMLRHLLPNIPAHNTYVEPFFGGGALFFAKEPSHVEVINDLNRFVVNFYEQCKINFDELQLLVQATPHSRAAYRDALVMYDAPHLFSDVRKAWAFWMLTNQGYCGKIGTWGYGTASNERERSLHHKRENFVTDIRDRLERTQVDCTDALYVIELRDRTNTFFYVDPPYYNSNMGHYGGYTEQDFENLLLGLEKVEGKFLLSSYPSELLSKYTERNGWHTLEIEMATMASEKRKPKKEMLTANYPIQLGS
jgi:DNA adenine methylase